MIKPGSDYSHNAKTGIPINPISLNDKSAWEHALSGVRHSVFQTWSYCNAIQQSQENPIEMMSIKNNNSGLLVIFSRRSKDNVYTDIYSPYGFGGILLWGSEDQIIRQSFETWMLQNNIVTAFLMAHPVLTPPNDHDFTSHRSAFVLDLSASEEEIWKGMGSSHTYELKKLFKDTSVTITDNKKEIGKIFPALYQDTLSRVGARSAYFFSEETLLALVNDPNTLILAGRINEVIHAVVLINYSSDCAEYFINATDSEGRNLTRLLLWEGIKRLKAFNIPTFNLGGGATEGDQLEAFKKRFGGRQAAIPVYKKIMNRDRYNNLCQQNEKDPADVSYFPPYWKQ